MPDTSSPAQLTERLHREIPLTVAMQLEVAVVEPWRILVRAPLLPNRNLHGTAFAGSLATTAIISGWLMVDSALTGVGLGGDVVAQASHCDYKSPVQSAFEAESRLDPDAFAKLQKMLQRMKRGRIEIATVVRAAGVDAMHHQGTYAALLGETKP